MILVNDPGTWSAVYWPLRHAEWNGWTPTDLIFPFFLFIVGVSMAFSFSSRAQRGATRAALVLHTLRRSAIILALGWFLNAFPTFRLETMRYAGVLPRIAVCYLLTSLVFLFAGRGARIGITAALLLGYWALMVLVPVPGVGAGHLDPQNNLAAYLDRALLPGKFWQGTWDPEGLLSTLPAIASTLLGVFLGEWLRAPREPRRTAIGMLALGAAGLVLGQIWNLAFPINKNIWTSSYVVFTAGFAAALLGVCYWLIEVQGVRRWATPFVVYGVNPIAAYFLSSLTADILAVWKTTLPGGVVGSLKDYIFLNYFAPLASPVNTSLLFAFSYVVFWLGAMWILYRRRWFIRI
jgi:predicted acyltransferase